MRTAGIISLAKLRAEKEPRTRLHYAVETFKQCFLHMDSADAFRDEQGNPLGIKAIMSTHFPHWFRDNMADVHYALDVYRTNISNAADLTDAHFHAANGHMLNALERIAELEPSLARFLTPDFPQEHAASTLADKNAPTKSPTALLRTFLIAAGRTHRLLLGVGLLFALFAIIFVTPFFFDGGEPMPVVDADMTSQTQELKEKSKTPISDRATSLVDQLQRRIETFKQLEQVYISDPAAFERVPSHVTQWKQSLKALGYPPAYKPYKTEAELAAERLKADKEKEIAERQAIEAYKTRLNKASEQHNAGDHVGALDSVYSLMVDSNVPESIAQQCDAMFAEWLSESPTWILSHVERRMPTIKEHQSSSFFSLRNLAVTMKASGNLDHAERYHEEMFQLLAKLTADHYLSILEHMGMYFTYYGEEKHIRRVLKLAEAALEDYSPTAQVNFASRFAGLSERIGDTESAKYFRDWIWRFDSSTLRYSSDDTRAYYRSYAYAGNPEITADPATQAAKEGRYSSVPPDAYNWAITSYFAAENGNDELRIRARRQALKLLRDSRRDVSLYYLACSDAVAGEFELAEKRATTIDGIYRNETWSKIAGYYAQRGLHVEALRALEQKTSDFAYYFITAAYQVAKAQIRAKHRSSDVLRWAESLNQESAKASAILGIYAADYPDLEESIGKRQSK